VRQDTKTEVLTTEDTENTEGRDGMEINLNHEEVPREDTKNPSA
jgi:hypothetical protein